MNLSDLMEAVEIKLNAISGLTSIVGTRISFDRGPISSTWPQCHYFNVAEALGYKIDYDSAIVQISIWGLSADKFNILTAREAVKAALVEFSGSVSVTNGTLEINWSDLTDAGALPTDDNQLYGEYLRINFRYRGENLGG